MSDEGKTVAELLEEVRDALAHPGYWDGTDTESDRLRKIDAAIHLLLKAVERMHAESENQQKAE